MVPQARKELSTQSHRSSYSNGIANDGVPAAKSYSGEYNYNSSRGGLCYLFFYLPNHKHLALTL
eukprot:Pgem_evm1s5170